MYYMSKKLDPDSSLESGQLQALDPLLAPAMEDTSQDTRQHVISAPFKSKSGLFVNL